MKLTNARMIYALLIVLFLGVIISSVYYSLGGFEEVLVYRQEPVSRIVAGRQFNTHFTDNAPRDFGLMCRELIENGDIDGTLTIVSYLNDTLSDDQVSKFIGITLKNDMAELPRSFQIKEMVSGVRYVIFLGMHVLVQPRPPKIEQLLREAAAADGYELEDFFVEIRYIDNSLSVEGWVKN